MPKILNRLLIAAILTLLLSEISAVSAQYKPPSDQPPPRGVTSFSGR
jgi:hypothetical protein